MNVKDIPRTLEAVRNLPTNIRYRIAMQVGAIPSDKDAIAGLAARPLEEQAQAILAKLLEIDAAGGGLPQAPPPIVRNPDPVAPQQGQQPAYPQQVGVPQQLGAQPSNFVPPQQLGGQPVQVAQQPLRTPVTATDPGTPGPANGASQAAMAASGLASLISKIDRLTKMVDEEVPGVGDVQELQEAVMGIATSVNTLVIIGLLILERVNDDVLPRSVIYDMIREQLVARTSEQLMGALKGPVQGK